MRLIEIYLYVNSNDVSNFLANGKLSSFSFKKGFPVVQ